MNYRRSGEEEGNEPDMKGTCYCNTWDWRTSKIIKKITKKRKDVKVQEGNNSVNGWKNK